MNRKESLTYKSARGKRAKQILSFINSGGGMVDTLVLETSSVWVGGSSPFQNMYASIFSFWFKL